MYQNPMPKGYVSLSSVHPSAIHGQMASDARQYPTLDPSQFVQSAAVFEKLMKGATQLVEQVARSGEFAMKLMDAAQKNKKGQVKQLLQSAGVQEPFDVTYNPDEIRLVLYEKTKQSGCCQLILIFRWS